MRRSCCAAGLGLALVGIAMPASAAVPYRSYVKGWKISPSHFLNQDLATIWLDK